MSIKLMTVVWERFPASGSELLAMLALADWAADDGGSLYPSMQAVADKIRLSEKQARRIVHGFVADGFLSVVGNEHGGAPGTTKQFKLNVRKLFELPEAHGKQTGKVVHTPPAGVTPPADVTPPMGVRDGSHRCPETAPTGGSQTVNRTIIEPSIGETRVRAPAFPALDDENSKPQQSGQQPEAVSCPADVTAAVFADFVAMRKAKKSPLNATALVGIRREAEKAGMSLEDALITCCARDWKSFRADWMTADDQPAPVKSQRPTVAQSQADVARTTVPGRAGPDPELQRIKADAERAAPMPADVRAKLLKFKVAA